MDQKINANKTALLQAEAEYIRGLLGMGPKAQPAFSRAQLRLAA